MTKKITRDEVFRNGDVLDDWAYDEDMVTANVGSEYLIHYKGSFYLIKTEWGNKVLRGGCVAKPLDTEETIRENTFLGDLICEYLGREKPVRVDEDACKYP